MKQILVLIPMDEPHRQFLAQHAPNACFTYSTADTVDRGTVQKANIIIGNPPPAMITGSSNLEWLQLNSAGADAYLKENVLPSGTVLTNATGAYGLAISEHMVGVLLQLYKKLHLYRDNQSKCLWEDRGEVKSIYGSTVLAVGLGDIGGEFAKRIKALGGYVIGIRRSNAAKPDYVDELYLMDQLDEVLPRADVVALSLPGTKETYHLFSRARIARMKHGAVLLNVGRGTAVDTDALCDALESGQLSGAGVDVTDPEPLPAGHRLWSVPNMVVTPHVSGAYHLQETYERIVRISAENLQRFLKGESLKNQVDFSTGYRKL